MGSFMEIMNNQIRIPEDISLLCFERDAIFDTLSSKITSIEQNYTALGMGGCKAFSQTNLRWYTCKTCPGSHYFFRGRLCRFRRSPVKNPAASYGASNLLRSRAAGYLTLAAVAKWTCKHVRLARCSRE